MEQFFGLPPAPAPARALLTRGSVSARAASRAARDDRTQSRNDVALCCADAGRSEGACARNDAAVAHRTRVDDEVDEADDVGDVGDAKTRSRATVATRRVHVHALASADETRAVDGTSSGWIVRPKPRLS